MTPIKLSDIPQDSRLAVAEQIAANLTAHNKLLVAYTAEKSWRMKPPISSSWAAATIW